MADIVLGIGTSHTPLVSMKPDLWPMQGDFDRNLIEDYDERVRRSPDWLRDEFSAEACERKYASCQAAIETLRSAIEAADPDVIVVIGDDQHEMFLDDLMPMVAVFRGSAVVDRPIDTSAWPSTVRSASWAVHGDVEESYPCHPPLANHLINCLVAEQFDIATVASQADGRTLGHAYTFVRRRLLRDRGMKPMIPVFLNTYYAPNTPSTARCVRLGRSLADGILSYPEDVRVAVVASGGLSHFIVDEDFDREVIRCLEQGDAEALSRLPDHKMVSGTSETLNWITAGAALTHAGLTMQLVDYVPAYRSLASSGVGCTFGIWR